MSEEKALTLRGSSELVREFFECSVHNILYQRGIYPPETFKRVPKYGLSMVVSTDDAVNNYLNNILRQLHEWLVNQNIKKLILVVKGVDSGNTLERWVFNCEIEGQNENAMQGAATKPQKEITSEIQAIMRQITASVTFLPLLEETCSFDLLVYTDRGAEVPLTWEDSDPCIITNAEHVQLRSFSTKVHKVELKVSYRLDESL